MAAINFPGSPSVNDVHTENGKAWKWDGTSWLSILGYIGYTGSTGVGYTGSIGYNSSVAGYTGSTGNALKSIYISSPSASETIVLFYTTVSITLSKVKAVLTGSSPNVTYSIKSGSDITSTLETHVSSQTVTSTTTGTDATIADSSITAGRWVWLETTTNSGTVTSIIITLEF